MLLFSGFVYLSASSAELDPPLSGHLLYDTILLWVWLLIDLRRIPGQEERRPSIRVGRDELKRAWIENFQNPCSSRDRHSHHPCARSIFLWLILFFSPSSIIQLLFAITASLVPILLAGSICTVPFKPSPTLASTSFSKTQHWSAPSSSPQRVMLVSHGYKINCKLLKKALQALHNST